MRPSAGLARRAAVPRDPRGRIDPEGAEADRRVYAASPTIEPTYEIEWIRSDLADIEISKFVSGIAGGKSTASRNNPRRCCRTSTSSGYSSHSPPLSAGSYSYYASTRDPSYGGLAVIHESEAIPRPIWPTVFYHRAEDRSGDYEGTYTCRVCGCTYNYSPLLTSPPSRAREVLLELSRTLNSVIEGDITAAPEDVLRDISRIVSLEINARNDNVYEYVCPSWAFGDKNPTVRPNCVPSSRANPIDSKSYVGARCLYGYNLARSAPSLKNDRTTSRGDDNETKKNSGLVRKKPCETEPKYSTQLVCSDVGSSTEGTIASLSGNDWNRRLTVRGLGEDFDFTLDVTQTERLGRMIARAKRKRQWCRVLITLFGLVFFVLSVVVVSLSVTRGRKVFGSM